MNTLNPIALAASVVITALGLAALNGPARQVPVNEINGTPITNLAPVTITASAADMREALLGDVVGATSVTVPALVHRHATAANLFGSQLVMPYYSFGNKLGHIGKE